MQKQPFFACFLLAASSGGSSESEKQRQDVLVSAKANRQPYKKKSWRHFHDTYFLNVHSNLRLFLPTTRDLTFLTCFLHTTYQEGLKM